MRATAAPVEGNRMRLSVEVDEAEIDEALTATLRRLGQQIRVPGFRPGKVPRQVLEARLGGPEALRQQAISDALPDLYARAVVDTELDPIAAPEIDIVSGGDSGPVTFDAVVEVRPTVAIPGYQGLVVTVPSIAVGDEDVDAQIDRLRDQSAELRAADRPARTGDHVTIDLHGTREGADDLSVEDYLYEVGSGAALPGLDEQLAGAKAGDILQFTTEVPGPEGEQQADVRVLVKEIKEKVLPEATDEWAAEASEFDTLEALRADLRKRLGQIRVVQAQLTLRERALSALVELVEDEPPAALVEGEVRERLHDLGHRLEARRMTVEQFLAASGRDEQTLLAEIREESAAAVRGDLALRALADAEQIEVTDEELDEAIADMAEQAGVAAKELRRRLEHAGRLPAVRSDRRKAKALAWLLEHVEVVDDEGNPVSPDDLRIDATGGDGADSHDEQSGAASGDAETAGDGRGSSDVDGDNAGGSDDR
ncbi:MAG TPA: trigger factor [Acidimicrobiales bacterium]|nr:trigger factor [Acidimicrobiales bacterium]